MILELAHGGDLQYKVDHMIQAQTRFEESTILSKSQFRNSLSLRPRVSARELIAEWMVQLLQAVEYIHGSQLLHCDIKTANIFLDQNMEIKLGDFGTARLRQQSHTGSSESRLFVIGRLGNRGGFHGDAVVLGTRSLGG